MSAAQLDLFEGAAAEGLAVSAGWETPDTTPTLTRYDWVLLNSSAGKDSMATKSHVLKLCDAAGVDRTRIVVVHADLGRVEWPGARELAQAHAVALGLRFEVVRRDGVDLLDRVLTRNATLRAQEGDTGSAPPWHGPGARSCTSDFKTRQVERLMVRLVNETRATGVTRRVRILNTLGLRAAESVARAKKTPFGRDPAHWTDTPVTARPATRRRPAVEGRPGRPHGRREVDRWLPIFTWTTTQVWAEITASGLTPHPAYALGADRLSCVYCFYAPMAQFVLAARHNIELAREYQAVEIATGYTYRPDGVSMTEIIAQAETEGLIAA